MPPTHMFPTRKIRKIFMASMIGLFFIVAPIIVFYTAGYRYNWPLHRLEQTGVLSIDAEPRDAEVYLNDVKIMKQMPIRLANRAPGTYSLSIEKHGYKPWKKEITIESKRTTYIKNIKLFKNAIPQIIIETNDRGLMAMRPSASGKYLFLLFFSNGIYDIEIMNTGTGGSTSVARYQTKESPDMLWSPFEDVGAIRIHDSEGWKIQLIDAKTGEMSDTRLLKDEKRPDKYQWIKGTPSPTFYIEDGNDIFAITLFGSEIAGTIPNGFIWHQQGNILWLADHGKHIIYNKDMPESPTAYSQADELESIVDINETRVILKTANEIIVNRLNPASTQKIQAQSLIYHKPTKEWIAWSQWELWSIYENGGAALLNRTSDATISVFPLDDYGVLLLATNSSLTAFNPGYYINHILLSGGVVKNISVNAENRRIYFFGSYGEREGLFYLDF